VKRGPNVHRGRKRKKYISGEGCCPRPQFPGLGKKKESGRSKPYARANKSVVRPVETRDKKWGTGKLGGQGCSWKESGEKGSRKEGGDR